jgi:signal transduction histidine kinase
LDIVLIDKREIIKLSADIRGIIDGQDVELRDNREGVFSILKNDIYTLASLKNEQVNALQRDKTLLKDTLANISHQLKTPLTSIIIMADLLENAPPDKQLEFITNIRVGLARMEWLVTALLKMAKLDAGVVEFSEEFVTANSLINLALEPLQILLDGRNQQMVITGDARLFCDRHWTVEALTNIIKNASEHSPPGGEIRAMSGENPICSWIGIADSGEGIPKAEIAGIFKRFLGSHSVVGYGIGLPLALSIMRGQNGDIEVENGADGGAVFTLKFFR